MALSLQNSLEYFPWKTILELPQTIHLSNILEIQTEIKSNKPWLFLGNRKMNSEIEKPFGLNPLPSLLSGPRPRPATSSSYLPACAVTGPVRAHSLLSPSPTPLGQPQPPGPASTRPLPSLPLTDRRDPFVSIVFFPMTTTGIPRRSTVVSATPPPPRPGARADKIEDTASPPKLRDLLLLLSSSLLSPPRGDACGVDRCRRHGHAPVPA